MRAACLLIPMLLASRPVPAQEDIDNLFELELEELMVIAVSKQPDAVREAPALVTVYTRSQLDRLQPKNVMELLELTTGFHVERDLDDLIIGSRGIITDNNQKFMIAIDGHRISNNANLGLNPFHRTRNMIAIAERIEIIHGPGGVFWGPDAYLGLINIVTKTSAGDEPFALTTTYGPTDGALLVALSAHHDRTPERGPLAGKTVRTSLFLDYIDSDGEEISTSLTGRGGLDTTPGTFIDRFEATSGALNFRAETDGSWASGQFLRNNLSNEQAAGKEEFTQAYLEIGHGKDLGRHHLTARGYFDFYELSRDVPAIGLSLTFGEERLGTEVLLESRWSDTASTIFGWDGRYYDYDRGKLAEAFQAFPGQGFFADGSLTTNGLFGQLEKRQGKWLFHIGGRVDHFSDDVSTIVTPRASAAYEFNPRYTLKLRYNEASLRPSWAQLTAFFSNGGERNLQVGPESLESIEAQLIVRLPRYQSSLTAYRTDASDTIGLINSAEFTTVGVTYSNFADYRIDGLEWENRLALTERAELFWNATYFWDLDRTETKQITGASQIIPGTDDPYGVPDLILNAGATLSWQLCGHALSITPIGRFKSSQRFPALDGLPDIESDVFEADFKADLVLGDAMRLALNGYNVLDNRDPAGLGQGDPGLVIPKGATWELSLLFEF